MPISTPSQITVPFATSGLKNAIPAASNPVTGNAGYDAGFPATNMTPKEAGGIPPFGQDFNGILFDITTAIQYLEAGMQFPYSSAFATAVGGYPLGAIVTRTDGSGFWRNIVPNNTTNPETFGAGWNPEGAGISTVAMRNANVTLTALQAARPIIIITGTLTANLQLIFPTYQRQWLIANNATGAFTVTVKTAAGSGVSVATGTTTSIYGEGTNILASAAFDTPGVSGVVSGLKGSTTGVSAIASYTADSVAVINPAGNQVILSSVSISPSLAALGVNGLDVGSSAASTWYSSWVIYNPTTQAVAGLLSLSQTSPTMPSGYTYKAYVGSVLSDATANKYPLGMTQLEWDVTWKVAPGTNVATTRVIVAGTSGNPATPSYTSISWANFAPPRARAITITAKILSAGLGAIAAPNSSYGSYSSTTNLPPLAITVTAGGAQQNLSATATIFLESSTFSYACNDSGGSLAAQGYKDYH